MVVGAAIDRTLTGEGVEFEAMKMALGPTNGEVAPCWDWEDLVHWAVGQGGQSELWRG